MRQGDVPDPRALADDWLRERMNIFSGVTVPSVKAQVRMPHVWLVFLDEQTPLATRRAMMKIAEDLPILCPVYCGALDARVYRSAVSKALPEECDWLITTRLDNDDAIHPMFLNVVQSVCIKGDRQFINPTQGLIVANGLAYRKRDRSSPFISYCEPVEGFRTVWMDQHQRLSRHGVIRQLKLQDAWVQYVHGGNLANQVRGWRVLPKQINQEFLPELLRHSLRDASWTEWAADNSLGLLKRYSGSIVRRLRRLRREWVDRKAP